MEKENYAEPTFQENAFLARKAKEAERRRTHRLMKTVQHSPLDTTKTNSVKKKDGKHMEKDLRAVARYSQEVKHYIFLYCTTILIRFLWLRCSKFELSLVPYFSKPHYFMLFSNHNKPGNAQIKITLT